MTESVRVRFAPSPTGPLHIGNSRAALFNYLFARRHGGVFILRVEDTDTTRSEARYEKQIFDTLRWLGMDWDEGPDKGGAFGPYRQSERGEHYRQAVARMIAADQAYPCFCTPQRLEELKARQAAAKLPPRYDGCCRDLPADERQARLAAGEPHTIRFRTPRFGEIECRDVIRGRVKVALKNLDDFIMVRSNGDPGFILAGAVDDILMKITHVLRGEDHLTNTHRQLLIFRALGHEPPVFGHLPLIVGDDGKPLSKRLGDLGIFDLRAQGYVAEVLTAHMARLGWAAPPEVWKLAELAAAFEVDTIAKKPSRLGLTDLRHGQARWIRQASAEERLAAVEPFLGEQRPAGLVEWLALFADDAGTLRELAEKVVGLASPPAFDEAARAVLQTESARAVLREFLTAVELAAVLDAPVVSAAIATTGERTGCRGKQLYQPIRLALQGTPHGPELSVLAPVLGREETLARLRRAMTADS